MATEKSDSRDLPLLEAVDVLFFENYFGKGLHLTIRRSDDSNKWGIYKRSVLVAKELPVLPIQYVTAQKAWDALKVQELTNTPTDEGKAEK